MMDPIATEVVRKIAQIVESDGSSLQLISLSDGTASLHYAAAEGPDCESCVWSPDDLGEFVLDALQQRGLPVERVEVISRP